MTFQTPHFSGAGNAIILLLTLSHPSFLPRTVFKAVPELYFIFLIVPTYVSLGKVPNSPGSSEADRELKLKGALLGMGKKIGHQTLSMSSLNLMTASKSPSGLGTIFCSYFNPKVIP